MRTDGNFGIDDLTIGTQAKVLPEPSAVLLFGLGLVGLGFALRRRGLCPPQTDVKAATRGTLQPVIPAQGGIQKFTFESGFPLVPE